MAVRKYGLLMVVLGCSGEKTPSRDGATAQASAAEARSAGPAPSTQNPAPAPKFAPGSIILFAGTSLTAGYGLDPDSAYPQLVQRKIDSAGLKFDVVNAGVSGETSSALLRRLRWLMNEPFEIIVIETGANDGLRGVPIETMAANIQQIIDGVRAMRPRAQIMLVQMEAPPNLGRDYTRRFRDVFPELAKRNNVILLPFLLDKVAGFRALNQADGIHPNDAGERIVAENLWRALRPLIR